MILTQEQSERAKKKVEELILEHPSRKTDIRSAYYLMLDEVEYGESFEHEFGLFEEFITGLIFE